MPRSRVLLDNPEPGVGNPPKGPGPMDVTLGQSVVVDAETSLLAVVREIVPQPGGALYAAHAWPLD